MSGIIAIHGQLGMAGDWDVLSPIAKDNGYHVEALDLWSILENEKFSLNEFGVYLNTCSKYTSAEVLIGYSMGGRLALHALVADPTRWKAVVIVSAHLGLKDDELKVERERVDEEWSRKVRELDWEEFLTEWNKQPVLSGEATLKDRLRLKQYRAEISKAFSYWSLANQENLVPQLTDIQVPILFVTGEEDKKFHDHLSSVVQDLNQPNIQLLSLPGVGHRVPWESEKLFKEKCFDWIGQQS